MSIMLFAACSSDDIAEDTSNDALSFKIENTTSTATSSHSAVKKARTMTTPAVTTFEVGDCAGLYAVKGNQTVLQNVKLTYNVNGFWDAPEAIKASDYEGATFYAYYPYNADAQFDAAATDPFAEYVDACAPAADQSQKSAYEAADLMTSGKTNVGNLNTVTFSLQHRMGLISMQLPNVSYVFTNSGLDPYVVAKAENASFTLNGKTIQPYFEEQTQSYLYIVKPQTEGTLDVSFTDNGNTRHYAINDLASMAEGERAHYVIDGGADLRQHTLAVGDYYCADGSLLPASTAKESLPSNVIGVVVKIGTTDVISEANSAWSHGVVLALGESYDKWGNDKSTTSEQNSAGWRTWYKGYGLSDQGVTSADKLQENQMAEEGYEVTKAWRAIPEPLTIGGISLDYTSFMNATLDSWIADTAAPSSITTGWYLPSLRDWQNIEASVTTLQEQLANANGTSLRWDGKSQYWSVNVRAAGSNWCYVGNKTTLKDRYKGTACNSRCYYRFLLAF